MLLGYPHISPAIRADQLCAAAVSPPPPHSFPPYNLSPAPVLATLTPTPHPLHPTPHPLHPTPPHRVCVCVSPPSFQASSARHARAPTTVPASTARRRVTVCPRVSPGVCATDASKGTLRDHVQESRPGITLTGEGKGVGGDTLKQETFAHTHIHTHT